MPRLSGNNDPVRPPSPGGISSRRRRQLSAMLQNFPVQFNLRNIFLGLVTLFVLRNFLRNDYRKEQIQYLRDSGMTEEQIERYIPKTAAERKKYIEAKANDLEQMKKDIVYLLNEVSEMKVGRGMATDHEKHGGGRDETLSIMDNVHAEKRKKREEQLLKDHPNFKPSKRLRDKMVDETKAQ